jgi:excisionase family DNA binding protein
MLPRMSEGAMPSVQRIAPQQFFTIVEAAELLKVSADTVRRMLRRGQLRCLVITERTRRIPLEAINELVQKGMNNETSW